MNVRAHSFEAAALRSPTPQRGVVVFLALVTALTMALSAVALLRVVDTTTAVTGNLGFMQSAVGGSDAAVEHAVAALFERVLVADPSRDDPTQGYFAAVQTGENARGVPAVLQALSAYPALAPVVDGGDGNAVRYVIERMCVTAGPPDNCNLVATADAPVAPRSRCSVSRSASTAPGAPPPSCRRSSPTFPAAGAWRGARSPIDRGSRPSPSAACGTPALRCRRPASASHRLEPRVELHAFRAVTCSRRRATAPAAERVERHRHGNGHVDAHHADFASSNRRAASPEFVKIAVPLPYGFLLTSSMASSSESTRITTAPARRSPRDRSSSPAVTRSNSVGPRKKPSSDP